MSDRSPFTHLEGKERPEAQKQGASGRAVFPLQGAKGVQLLMLEQLTVYIAFKKKLKKLKNKFFFGSVFQNI